jgi:hypothetical protein
MNVWAILAYPAISFMGGVVFKHLVEYMLDRYKDRRDMQIFFGSHNGQVKDIFYVENTGTKPENPIFQGFKYRDEPENESVLTRFGYNQQLQPHDRWPLAFPDKQPGLPPIQLDHSRLEYVYVKDDHGWTKRLYFHKGKPVGKWRSLYYRLNFWLGAGLS